MKRKELPSIFSSQFIAANHLFQSDNRIYWSSGNLEETSRSAVLKKTGIWGLAGISVK